LSDAGQQVTAMADALRSTSQQMRDQGNDRPADMAERAASQVERLGTYLSDQDAERLVRDVEDFARRQPWPLAALGFVGGLAAARFLKASSERRYQTSIDSGRYAYPAYPTYERPAYDRPGYAAPGGGLGEGEGLPTTGATHVAPGGASDIPLGGASSPASI
jgi:hypothetical protein